MFGLKREGFKRKKYADVVASLRNRATNIFGEDVNLNNNSFLGMFINVIAWAISILWELAESVYFNKYVDYAEGSSLDLAARNHGITRLPSEKSSGVAIFNGEVPVGTIVKVNNILFKTIEVGTEVEIEAEEGGATGNITSPEDFEIVTPVPGVDSFTAHSFEGGRDIETDAELRARFFASLEAAGASTLGSIVSALLRTEGVTAANVEEIEEAGYYKGIRPIVLGGEHDDIAQTVFNYKAFGVKTIGEESGQALADNGDYFTINFDYATEKLVTIMVEVIIDERFHPDGYDRIKSIVEDYVNNLSMGENVIYSNVIINAFSEAGVVDVDVTLNGAKQNIEVAFDEVAIPDVTVK